MKKQIAIIALRRSVPSELYQDVVAIVIKSDQDPDVRRVAIREAATFQSAPEVAAALAQIIQNPQRSSEERQIAQSTLGQLGLNSIAPEGAFTFFSALPAQQSLENSATGSSIFSFYLIIALSGGTAPSSGKLSIDDLADYLKQSVFKESSGAQRPAWFNELDHQIYLDVRPSKAIYTKTVAIVIGNSMYKLPNLNLRYAASDAVKFGKLLVSKGATVYSLVNGTRKQMLETIEQSEGKDVENSLLIFYYAGQAIYDASGRSWLLPTDFKSDVLDPEALSQTAISGA